MLYAIRNDKREWLSFHKDFFDITEIWDMCGGDAHTNADWAKANADAYHGTVVLLYTPEELQERIESALKGIETGAKHEKGIL